MRFWTTRRRFRQIRKRSSGSRTLNIIASFLAATGGSVTIGGQVLMGGDVEPSQYEAPKGFSLSLQIKNTAEAERIFPTLADGGEVVIPLDKTFWAERFGMVVDRFGVPWMINCEGTGQAREE